MKCCVIQGIFASFKNLVCSSFGDGDECTKMAATETTRAMLSETVRGILVHLESAVFLLISDKGHYPMSR